MPRYLVERSFTDGLHIPMDAIGAKTCAEVVGTNLDYGVTWVHSYVTPDKAGRNGVRGRRLPRDPRRVLYGTHWLRGREDLTMRGRVPCADHHADRLGDGVLLRSLPASQKVLALAFESK